MVGIQAYITLVETNLKPKHRKEKKMNNPFIRKSTCSKPAMTAEEAVNKIMAMPWKGMQSYPRDSVEDDLRTITSATTIHMVKTPTEMQPTKLYFRLIGTHRDFHVDVWQCDYRDGRTVSVRKCQGSKSEFIIGIFGKSAMSNHCYFVQVDSNGRTHWYFVGKDPYSCHTDYQEGWRPSHEISYDAFQVAKSFYGEPVGIKCCGIFTAVSDL